jgi:flagellar hook-associated protein 1 FlgK
MFNMMNIGRKALAATERQLHTTAHNIANVNTPGFSRQRVVQQAADPIFCPHAMGTGVDVIRIERMRDLYLDNEFRQLNSNTGFWNSMNRHLTALEKNINENSENGINAMINNFFNSWESLSNNPFNTIHRMQLVSASNQMIDSFQGMYRSIENKIEDVKFDMRASVDRINQIADELAHLTHSITSNTAAGKTVNDLMDRFDLFIDELSSFGNVQVHHRDNGTMSVYLGSDELVRNELANRLVIHENTHLATGEQQFYIGWHNTPREVAGLHSGSLKALANLKDNVLPSYLEKLDDLAVQIAQNVNAIHTRGFTAGEPPINGISFFDPKVTGVMSLSLSDAVLADPSFIVASLTGASGDNQIALAITDLRLEKAFNGLTLTETFADFIYEVGQDIRFARSSAERSGMLSQQTDNFRESVKGVSMNEETANLMRFQQTYQAAARIISVADDMFRTILGLVR